MKHNNGNSNHQLGIESEMDRRFDYWESYYARSVNDHPPPPSQFSVFVLGELTARTRIFDIGCGAGRDAFFFALHGHRVVGVDVSNAAIRRCTTFNNLHKSDITFIRTSITDNSLFDTLNAPQPDDSLLEPLVYARFFLHVITDEEETHLFELAHRLCNGRGLLALEFRTIRDARQAKATPDHYRRFIDPLAFLEKARAAEFRCKYYVEGFGFAKYRNDDAYVARCLLAPK